MIGNPHYQGYSDGVGTNSWFFSIRAIAYSSLNQNTYVVDWYLGYIRKFSSSGQQLQ